MDIFIIFWDQETEKIASRQYGSKLYHYIVALKQSFEKTLEEVVKKSTGYNGIKTCKIALQYLLNY